ncbi:MAG: EAL domain-containing protein [Atopobiaceae bacterium]|nr:EAL domain-containing protein [Atopobiaceae bacterium]
MPDRSLVIQADFDELTNLPNMMYFRQYASAYVRAAQRKGKHAYLVYFNLESFSIFNERYGFEEGDRLLRLMSTSIQEAFPGFLLSRFSEDHFFLVCESLNLVATIEDLHEQIRSFGRNANVELKAGIYEFPSDKDVAVDIGVACDRAKVACESISHQYDRVYRRFDDALRWYMERQHYIESHVTRAVENEWIKVYFQPITRTITGKVCEFEALARWDDPRYGMLSPAIFVDVLEQSHLIHLLDAFVVRKVCQIWREMNDAGHGQMMMPISVNLSRLDFELCDTFEMVDATAREYGVPHQMLHVEITESALNQNADKLMVQITRFRDAGYQVWLDDFGSGWSSLNTLKDYTFDVVKIDMAFLREFNTKPSSRVIISSVVNLAKQLGMQTLIEGVELPEQYDFLHDIGCEFIQGYLIGRPLPVADSLKRIEAGELELDQLALSGYYNRLGSINALSASPFDFAWDAHASQNRKINEIVPLATIEYSKGRVSLISSNQSFENVVQDVGVGSASEFVNRLNEGKRVQSRTVMSVISTAVVSGRVELVDIMEHGTHCVMQIRHVASARDVDALLISLINITNFSSSGDENRFKIALQYLYAVYDAVNIVNLSTGVVSTLYRGNTVFPSVLNGDMFAVATRRFVRDYVHPMDRERCLRYLDLSTIETRMAACERGHLADAFRALNAQGNYEWIISVLVPLVVDDQHAVLICVRRNNEDALCSIMDGTEVPKDLLWDTLLELVPAGVFWKDKDRRFLGVNKNFLDFYEFSSANEVLGKNDEEMGWHVDTDPFKNNELRVIMRGEPVLNAHGTCLARGEVRNIVASKIPLCRNGEVVGLLGYFTEEHEVGADGGERDILDRLGRMAETDQLTDIPNKRGLLVAAGSYADSYVQGGPDFVCAVFDIRGMRDLNLAYGRSFGNRILKVVAKRFSQLGGVNCVVGRIGGDKFAGLSQVASRDDAQAVAERLKGAIESIGEVDGLPVHLCCTAGWALYSECEDAVELFDLADSRMREARRAARG